MACFKESKLTTEAKKRVVGDKVIFVRGPNHEALLKTLAFILSEMEAIKGT